MAGHRQVHVIEVERMRRGAIDQRRRQHRQSRRVADHRGDRRAALLLRFRQQDVGQLLLRAGERAGDIVQHALPRQRAHIVRQVGIAQRARLFGQRAGKALCDVMSVMTFMSRSSSTSLELRLALLVERADAFAAVLGRHHAVIRLDLEHHAAGEVHVQPVVHRLLDLPRRDRRVAGDGGGGLQRLGQQRVRRADAVHHAPLERLLRGERLAGEQDLLGAARAHRARQRSACRRRQA